MKNFDNFGGIFKLRQLSEIKLVSLPISFILLIDEHWISIFVNETCVEIMDSAGFMRLAVKRKELRSFLCPIIRFKTLKVSTQLQTDGSKTCGLFAVSFLYVRSFTDPTLCDFCNFFTTKFSANEKRIHKLFEAIVTD